MPQNKKRKKDKKVLAFLYVSRYTFPVSNNNTNNMTDPNEQHPEEESFFPQDDLADSVQELCEHLERVDAFLEEFNGFNN